MLFKFVALSVVAFLVVIPVLVGIYVRLTDGLSLTLIPYFENVWNEAKEMKFYLFVQVLVMAISIWLLGGLAGTKILDERKGKFKTGFLTIVGLWGVLFISSSLTEAIIKSFKWGPTHSIELFIGWFMYGFLIYLIIGVLHGLTTGYLLGNEIEKNKKRYANKG